MVEKAKIPSRDQLEKAVKKAFGQALKQARENYKGGRLT